MYPTYDQLFPILQERAKRWVPDFIVDDENKHAVRQILAWSCGHPQFEGDVNKGLLITGHKGSGKTLLLRALALCLDYTMNFQTHSTRKITSAYNADGDEGIASFTRSRHIAYDDLGDERTGQHYGDKVEVMSLVVQDRYEMFVDQGCLTHFTTNLTPSEIKERYGERVYSRLKHMVNIIRVGAEVNATDRRNEAPAPVARQPVRQVAPPEPASPEVVAAGFQKVKDVIASAKAQMVEAKPARSMEVVRRSPKEIEDEKMEVFKVQLRSKSQSELETLRDELEAKDKDAAAPLLELIDREIERRIAA